MMLNLINCFGKICDLSGNVQKNFGSISVVNNQTQSAAFNVIIDPTDLTHAESSTHQLEEALDYAGSQPHPFVIFYFC